MKETKITILSRVLKIVFFIAACLLPVIEAGYWITEGYPFLKPWIEWDIWPKINNLPIKPISEISPLIKFFGFLITLIPTAFNIGAFIFLAKLFSSFEKLQIFSEQSVKCLRKLGFCILLNQLVYPVYEALLSLNLTITNPPGQRMITVGFGTHQLNLLVIGACIILISWVMEEGRKLHEDQAGTI